MPKYSENTLRLLRDAGWSENRRFALLNKYKQALESNGFSVPAAIESFLNSFGGLLVKHPHAELKEQTDYFHFNVIKAISGGDPAWVTDEYSSRVGKQLCVIGEAFRRSMTLCMSSDKKVYAGLDDMLFLVGNSIKSAIETLCNGNDLEKIPEKAEFQMLDEFLHAFFSTSHTRNTVAGNQQYSSDEWATWAAIELNRFIDEKYSLFSYKRLQSHHYSLHTQESRYCIDFIKSISTQESLAQVVNDIKPMKERADPDELPLVIAIHPKTDMKKSEIKDYLFHSAQNEGVHFNHVTTRFIRNSQYAMTLSEIG